MYLHIRVALGSRTKRSQLTAMTETTRTFSAKPRRSTQYTQAWSRPRARCESTRKGESVGAAEKSRRRKPFTGQNGIGKTEP